VRANGDVKLLAFGGLGAPGPAVAAASCWATLYRCPATLAAIVELLVPELQRRGRFRREYKGRTLRENLFDE
jgi:hypothetical protein